MLELLQKQIFNRLTESLEIPISDSYSTLNDTFPILIISDINEKDYGIKTHDIRQCTIQLDLYSNYTGNKEIYSIYEIIRQTLTSNNLTNNEIEVMVKKPTVIILSDSVGGIKVIKHAVINYEITIKEA